MIEEVEKAMETIIHYCKNTECENCIFGHITVECGVHNPSCWKGVAELEERK